MADRSQDDRSQDRTFDELLEGRARRWWRLPSGVTLCGSVAFGAPMDVHVLGGHLLSDVGPISAVLALFAGATYWLFRRYGETACSDPGPTPEIAPESDLIWAELEAFEDESRPEPIEL